MPQNKTIKKVIETYKLTTMRKKSIEFWDKELQLLLDFYFMAGISLCKET